ncbi:class I SAM-dependent methyltransferase [Tepidiforma sp.]|uniref:class I SAM-dependent methyltransferase n=1 Tax=Tepidiforma sp. TaxID=2682230 RepID=UPI00260D0471|nr:class I SAM-dependent methyltransferase [Tepidiforma sp.]MCX7616907.1 class I SAM-dependent methyltransferase [Tepidiforma sp.]
MPSSAGHRRFAAAWDWLSRHESARERRLRARLAGQATGRVLEIGYGVGSNWPHLPADVDYVGIEPDPYMRERAEHHRPAGRELDLRDGDAQALDFPDASFDTVIGTLVLCTIPDPAAALREIRRVLRPGGRFVFWEHVNARGRAGRAVLGAITPLWSRVGGGCHPNRDTLEAIEAAGFAVDDLRVGKIGPLPAISGIARAAEAAP